MCNFSTYRTNSKNYKKEMKCKNVLIRKEKKKKNAKNPI